MLRQQASPHACLGTRDRWCLRLAEAATNEEKLSACAMTGYYAGDMTADEGEGRVEG